MLIGTPCMNGTAIVAADTIPDKFFCPGLLPKGVAFMPRFFYDSIEYILAAISL